MIFLTEKYQNIQISNMIDYGFRYWKNKQLRLEYSLYEYQQKIIPKRLNFFRHSIWLSFNGWIGIFYLLAMIIKPMNNIIIGNEHFKQLVHCQRTDLIFLFSAIAFIALELMWLHLLKKFLNYHSSIDVYFINNIDYNEKQLLVKFQKYLQKYFIISDLISNRIQKLFTL